LWKNAWTSSPASSPVVDPPRSLEEERKLAKLLLLGLHQCCTYMAARDLSSDSEWWDQAWIGSCAKEIVEIEEEGDFFRGIEWGCIFGTGRLGARDFLEDEKAIKSSPSCPQVQRARAGWQFACTAAIPARRCPRDLIEPPADPSPIFFAYR
jgi:hypothetical protein